MSCEAAPSPAPADATAARFWGKVARGGGGVPADACQEWAGAANSKVYGVFSVRGRLFLAHRYAYSVAVADPAGRQVLHRCDNRRCVNPDHLRLGTNADNVADMVAKGRQPRGEGHGRAKLTASAVAELRRRSPGRWGKLAAEFGASQRAIRRAYFGVTWGHVPRP